MEPTKIRDSVSTNLENNISGYQDFVPLSGGHSGEIFTATSQSDGQRYVLRVYGSGLRRRGPEAPEIQAGVLRLGQGLLPIPELIEFRRSPNEDEFGGLLVMTQLPGVCLDEVLKTASPDLSRKLGTSMGAVLGRMSGIAITGPGCFMNERLSLGLWPAGSESLITWLDIYTKDTQLSALSNRQVRNLYQLAELGDKLLARSHRACLVHGDLSARNVLCDPSTGEITGIIDWEFAHSGHPLEDAGKLLREDPTGEFNRSQITTLNQWLPAQEQDDIANLLRRARAADFYWLIEVASRRGQSPATERCYQLLLKLADTADFLGDANPTS